MDGEVCKPREHKPITARQAGIAVRKALGYPTDVKVKAYTEKGSSSGRIYGITVEVRGSWTGGECDSLLGMAKRDGYSLELYNICNHLVLVYNPEFSGDGIHRYQ